MKMQTMKRMTMKEQRDLLLSVGVMLANSEDPKHVQTATAMTGKEGLEKVGRVWRRVWKRVYSKRV